MELVSGKSSTSVPLESAMSQLVDFSPVRRAVAAPGHKKWPPSVSLGPTAISYAGWAMYCTPLGRVMNDG